MVNFQKSHKEACSGPLMMGLTAAVVIGFIIVFALAIDLGNVVGQRNSLLQGAQPLCIDANCLWEASEILNNMNQSVDPCEDFYEFACGNFRNLNPAADIFADITQFSLLQTANDAKLQEILNEPIKDPSSTSAEQKAKIFWASCLDTFTITERGGAPLLTALQSIGGWVPLGNFEWSNFNFNTQLQNIFSIYGAMPFFTLQVIGDMSSGGYYHTPTENIIRISFGNLGINNGYAYFPISNDSSFTQLSTAYEKYITTIIQNLWIDGGIQLANASQVLQQAVADIMYIERFMANLTLYYNDDSSRLGNPADYRFTLSYLDDTYGATLMWSTLLHAYYSATYMDDEYTVYSSDINYITAIVDFIASATPQQLNTYMMWRLVDMYVSELGWNYLHAQQDWLMIENGGDISATGIDATCFQQVQHFFGNELGHLFIMEQFTTYSYQQVQGIKNLMKATMLARISSYQWMDAQTKFNMTTLLANTQDQFGYPAWLLDSQVVDGLYSRVTMQNAMHFENMVNLQQLDIYLASLSLNSPIDMSDWPENIFDVNYDLSSREVYFPVGVLQHPFFQPNIPQYINFGAIGRLIGQSFATVLEGGMELTPETEKNYEAIETCHMNLYENVTIDGQDWVGFIFGTVDMGVVAGARVAYQAYQQYVTTYGAENLLPGLHVYSVDQVLFISFAQTFCHNGDDINSFWDYLARKSFDPPEKILLSGVMPQIPEFSAAFQCAKGTPMNNGHVCPGF